MQLTKYLLHLEGKPKFCPVWGTKILAEAYFTECGAKLAVGSKFCGECGAKVVN